MKIPGRINTEKTQLTEQWTVLLQPLSTNSGISPLFLMFFKDPVLQLAERYQFY
jgi:hypothetical protein